jgi:hypothetical protein
MFAHSELDRLSAHGDEVSRRLRARITPWELFALVLALSLLGTFVWIQASLNILPNDFYDYIQTASGDFRGYYYAYWMLPVFALLAKLPPLTAYAIWGTVNILCVFFAARVFAGRAPLALLSFQMLYVAFIGQIVGVILAGLALLWWGTGRRRWTLAGLGLVIACTKFQLGIVIGLILLLMAEISWRDRLRVIVVPVIVLVLSLVIYPMWPVEVLSTIRTTPANDWGSISLWRWIGPYALLFWIPPLLLPLSRPQRLVGLIATMALALPYFQQTDLLALFVMPIGWAFILLGNLGYLFFSIYWGGLQLLVVVPMLVYVSVIIPGIRGLITSWRLRTPKPQ